MARQYTRLTDNDKAYIRAAYARHESHRDIAKHLGCPHSTVARFMKAEGLLYDSSNQRAAITKNVLTAQERISALRLDVIGIAEHEAADILAVHRDGKPWKTVMRTTGGGEEARDLDFIPPLDKRSNASSLGSHAATIARLAPKEDGNTAQVESVMDQLITGLHKAYEGQNGAGSDSAALEETDP